MWIIVRTEKHTKFVVIHGDCTSSIEILSTVIEFRFFMSREKKILRNLFESNLKNKLKWRHRTVNFINFFFNIEHNDIFWLVHSLGKKNFLFFFVPIITLFLIKLFQGIFTCKTLHTITFLCFKLFANY